MGCVQAKGLQHSPPKVLEKLKSENGYVRGGSGGRPNGLKFGDKGELKVDDAGERKIRKEGEHGGNNGIGNVSHRVVVKKIGADELVDGWPKWLVDNMPRDALAGLVPKSADSYDKLAKVGMLMMYSFLFVI